MKLIFGQEALKKLEMHLLVTHELGENEEEDRQRNDLKVTE